MKGHLCLPLIVLKWVGKKRRPPDQFWKLEQRRALFPTSFQSLQNSPACRLKTVTYRPFNVYHLLVFPSIHPPTHPQVCHPPSTICPSIIYHLSMHCLSIPPSIWHSELNACSVLDTVWVLETPPDEDTADTNVSVSTWSLPSCREGRP